MNQILSYLGAFLLGLFTNYVYERLRYSLSPQKFDQFIKILRNINGWTTANGEVYYYKNDPNFRIKINKGQDVLAEKYKKFPDKTHDRINWVEAKYGQATIFGWNFMYLDGYRLLVPVPRTEYDAKNNAYDFYNLFSTELAVFEIIGKANLMGERTKIEGLKRVAAILDIKIVKL